MVAPLIVGAARMVGGTAAKQVEKSATKKASVGASGLTRKGRYNLQSYSKNKPLPRRFVDKKVTSILRNIFSQNNEVLDESDVKLLTEAPPVQPDFPFIMVGIAVLKDLLDTLDLTLIGIVFTTVFSFLIAFVLFFWFFGKMSGARWKKKLIKRLWKKYIIAIVIEFIPFMKIIPATTILVFMAHYKEVELVKLANQGLEELKRLGFLSILKK